MKKSTLILATALCGGTLLAASPVINENSVTLTQDPQSRLVTVNYTLSEAPAIVTAEFLTNGVSIGEQNFTNLIGAVNRQVSTLGRNTFTWKPYESAWAEKGISNAVMSVKVTAWPVSRPPDYMIVGLTSQNDVRYYTSTNAFPNGFDCIDYKTRYLVMRLIPAAGKSFRMGSYSEEIGSGDYRKRETVHLVTFTNDFYMAIYPTTQQQYSWFANNPSYFSGLSTSPIRPVEKVSYNSLRGDRWPEGGHSVTSGTFIDTIRNFTGLELDLPTDAQWEYACRAGTVLAINSNDNLLDVATSDALSTVAWYKANSDNETHPVGLKKPNAWGLYDMHGNVYDWCLDWMALTFGPAMSSAAVVEPVGYTYAQASEYNELQRCRRGGTFQHDAKICRSAWRGSEAPNSTVNNTGFRMVCIVY